MVEISRIDLLLITGTGGALVGMLSWLATRLHNQTMHKLDRLIDTVQGVTTQMAVHDEKLISGNVEFKKIELHQKEQDRAILKLDKRLTALEIHIEGNEK